jgi:hypothetical protein
LESGLQAWAADNNWEIVNPSVDRSCQDYIQVGIDMGMGEEAQLTLKPLGWDEGLEWNATLCVVIIEGAPCGQMIVTSVVPSLGVMLREE